MFHHDDVYREFMLRSQTNCDFRHEEIIVRNSHVYPTVRELVDREENERWLVWCEQPQAIRRAVETMSHRRVVAISGHAHPHNRASIFQRFRDGKIDVLVLTLNVGAVGVDLRPCKRNIFINPASHTWREREQAIQRTDRVGQLGDVRTYFVFGQRMGD